MAKKSQTPNFEKDRKHFLKPKLYREKLKPTPKTQVDFDMNRIYEEREIVLKEEFRSKVEEDLIDLVYGEIVDIKENPENVNIEALVDNMLNSAPEEIRNIVDRAWDNAYREADRVTSNNLIAYRRRYINRMVNRINPSPERIKLNENH